MAGIMDILIIGVVAVGGYFFYKRCIVDKQCGFGTTPVDPPPGPGGTCSGGYVKSGKVCICNPTAKGCTGSASCVHQTSTTCQCLKAGTTEVGTSSGCNAGQYRCKLSGGQCGCCKSGGTTTGCTKGYVKCTGGCCCNRAVKKCTSGQIVGVLNGICQCKNCPTGTKAGGANGNSCVPIGGTNVTICGNQANPAQAWIARVAGAMLYRMCNSCGSVPSITGILQGWPSLTQQCAMDNNCNTNKLHSSNATFNKHFATLLLAIRGAKGIPISGFAQGELSNQNNTGLWRLTPWSGGVAGYYTSAQSLQTRLVERFPKRVMVV